MSGSTPTSRRQKRMGPAPFASFEDLSDEVRSRLESPEDRNAAGSVVRLPGIREDATPTPGSTPLPLEQPQFVHTGISLVGALTLSPNSMSNSATSRLQPNTPRIDISRASSSSHHDSRDSTPERELFEAHDPSTAKLGLGFREEGALDLRSSTEELGFQEAPAEPKRKGKPAPAPRPPSPSILLHDSSDHHHQRKDSQSSELGLLFISGRSSRLSSIGSQGSGHSRLSNASHLSVVSGQSRSPSPHKMLLETSFCGVKPPDTKPKTKSEPAKDDHEDIEKVLLARKHDPTKAVLAEGITMEAAPQARLPDKPPRKVEKSAPKSEVTIKVDEPPSSIEAGSKIPKKIIAKSGVEYIYIPLKGPLPKDEPVSSHHKVRATKSASTIPSPTPHNNAAIKPKSAPPPKYIRIRLKPDHMYDQEPKTAKPDTLDLHGPDAITVAPSGQSLTSTPTASPKLKRANFLKETPSSPSLSRKSSFASLFRSKEAIMSPDNAGAERGRSKSRELPSSNESIDSKKSVFSFLKGKKTEPKKEEISERLPSIDGIAKVEFKFNDSDKKYYETALSGESVRIPLHSPTHYDAMHAMSSQESQETVIEVCRSSVEAVVEKVPANEPISSKRQSSTSSENVVFSTKLGSSNELFSTKLPKKSEAMNGSAVPVLVTVTASTIEAATSVVTTTTITTATVASPSQATVVARAASDRSSAISVDDEEQRYSSESERDSELEFPKGKSNVGELKLDLDLLEPERKGLVLQDSYEDELPYVPTTLPQERSAAVPIVPIKQRSTFEMKTCPIERPRSTTPINPSCLEDYCEEVMGGFNVESVTKTIEKLKISLPKHDSVDKSIIKSPRKPSSSSASNQPTTTTSTTNWFEFAEKGITAGRRPSLTQEGEATPPPLPPKGVQKEWINFEEIPERRKAPKRIQTLPSARGHVDAPESDNVVYNYVNPEECKCECHELRGDKKEKMPEPEAAAGAVQEDELPLLDEDDDKLDRIKVASDRRSVVSDSSVDLSTSAVEPLEANGGLELTLLTPFTSDLGMSSNRSSIVSQEETQSPDSPNAFPKTF